MILEVCVYCFTIVVLFSLSNYCSELQYIVLDFSWIRSRLLSCRMQRRSLKERQSENIFRQRMSKGKTRQYHLYIYILNIPTVVPAYVLRTYIIPAHQHANLHNYFVMDSMNSLSVNHFLTSFIDFPILFSTRSL